MGRLTRYRRMTRAAVGRAMIRRPWSAFCPDASSLVLRAYLDSRVRRGEVSKGGGEAQVIGFRYLVAELLLAGGSSA